MTDDKATNAPLLELQDVHAGYPYRSSLFNRQWVHAVSGISLQQHAGTTLGVVGESGCGKSTLAKVVAGLETPSSGKVLFDGHDLTRHGRRRPRHLRRMIQMVFQDPYSSLNPRMSIADIVAEGWHAHADVAPTGSRRAAVRELLDQVGINPDHADRRPHEFSGGQQQRIGIARSLAVKPRLIVLDEAVSALDVSIQAQILNLLSDLQENTGVSFFFVSHDLGVIQHVSSKVMVMYLGKSVELGNSERVLQQPLHPYTKALLQTVPQMSDWQEKSWAPALSGEVPSPLDPPSGCRFRTRCPIAEDLCAQQEPAMTGDHYEHKVACHFAEGH